MNDFSVGEAKICENNQIQSITLCSMHFSKKVYAMYNGVWGKSPEAGEFSRLFVSKITLVCAVTFNCKLQNKLGSRMY